MSAEAGPLPKRELAEIHNPATGERELSETGTAYYGSNWREVRKLYTADDVMAYGVQERAAERERWVAVLSAIAETQGYGAGGPSTPGWVHWQEQARRAIKRA